VGFLTTLYGKIFLVHFCTGQCNECSWVSRNLWRVLEDHVSLVLFLVIKAKCLTLTLTWPDSTHVHVNVLGHTPTPLLSVESCHLRLFPGDLGFWKVPLLTSLEGCTVRFRFSREVVKSTIFPKQMRRVYDNNSSSFHRSNIKHKQTQRHIQHLLHHEEQNE